MFHQHRPYLSLVWLVLVWREGALAPCPIMFPVCCVLQETFSSYHFYIVLKCFLICIFVDGVDYKTVVRHAYQLGLESPFSFSRIEQLSLFTHNFFSSCCFPLCRFEPLWDRVLCKIFLLCVNHCELFVVEMW